MADDSDVSLPRATLQKMIKDLLPPDMRMANDTVENVMNCCTEFIQLLSSESNEVATREGRSIIHPDHVVKALTELGFGEFVGEVNAAWEVHKEDTKTAHSRKADLRKTGAEQAGMTEEQQIALQQQMFAAARAQSLTTTESAAAMAAAYEQAMAAQQAFQQQQLLQQQREEQEEMEEEQGHVQAAAAAGGLKPPPAAAP